MKVNNMGQPNDLLVDDLELLLREIDGEFWERGQVHLHNILLFDFD